MQKHEPVSWMLIRRDGSGRLAAHEVKRLTAERAGYRIGAMPAMVHTILREHGEIDRPWKAGTAREILWVAETDWIYRAEFDRPEDLGEGPISIVVGGADAILDVYVDGRPVGSSETAYVPIRHAIPYPLTERTVVLLHFRSVFRTAPDGPTPIEYVDGNPERPVRKTEQNYLSYLGPHPRFCRVGVYAPVVIVDASTGELSKVSASAALSRNLNIGSVVCECGGSVPDDAELTIDLMDADGVTVNSRRVTVRGEYSGRHELAVRRPALWWPRGYGDQPLYTLRVTLRVSGSEVDSAERTIGFRLVEMPRPFHFTVNGVPVKLWGANWVSPDWADTVWNHEHASRLFDMAENANFNVMRVWGVVESPDNDFYEAADRRGILVWQDFTDMRLAPNDTNRRIAREEAAALVHRLRHHPCILMWCGDNESAMWHDFGGGAGPFPGREIAEQVIGGVVRELDPGRFYLPSTPYYGFDANDPHDHNTHGYTNLWFVHGYDYLNFATEDTRISAPELKSLRRFMRDAEVYPASYDSRRTPGRLLPWPDEWMSYTTSISERKVGPVEQFYDATDARSLVYRIGMACALYYRETIERQRRGRPADDRNGLRRCGGYIAWKFNDSWPEIYSAKVDYFLEPYIAYYALRRAYAPVLVSIDVGTYLNVWVVNDTRETVIGLLTVGDRHVETNESSRSVTRRVCVPPGCSEPIVELTEFRTIERRRILHAVLTGLDGIPIADSVALLDLERNIPFPEAKLELSCVEGVLEVRTDRFARSVVLSGRALTGAGESPDAGEFGWMFDDNYFDLMPGQTKRVGVSGAHRRGIVTARAFYSPHEASVEFTASDRTKG